MPRPRTTANAKKAESAPKTETATKTEAAKTTAKTPEFVCPECGRTFTRAASLGAHRRQTHKIPGATSRAAATRASSSTASSTGRTARRRRARASARTTVAASRASSAGNGATDRDALLRTLFPNGIPAKESVIRSVNAWLDEAERLTRLR
jgi:hypothetical protein